MVYPFSFSPALLLLVYFSLKKLKYNLHTVKFTLFGEQFHPPKKFPHSPWSQRQLPSPTLDNHGCVFWLAFSINGYPISGLIQYICVAFLRMVSFTQHNEFYILLRCHVYLQSVSYLLLRVFHCIGIQQFIFFHQQKEHLVFSHFWEIMNIAAINIFVQGFVGTNFLISLGKTTSCMGLLCYFIRNCQTVFQSCYTSLQASWQLSW